MNGIDNFYKGKRVFITGHTGFKGSWLSKVLINEGAILHGYSLGLVTNPSLFEIAEIDNLMSSTFSDVRNYDVLQKVFNSFKPEIVFHLAAQPIVRTSYMDPKTTYETNVLGTVNILECVRKSDCVKSFINITTDKVYQNKEWEWGYREDEPLDGYDPYSNSKSCSDLITNSYKRSFFQEKKIAISTVRAGNVIGGGDFAKDRIIPDCVRSVMEGKDIIVRNPHSVRPYQHVLDPLFAYLLLAKRQYEDISFAGSYNVGPNEEDCYSTGRLVQLFVDKWGDDTRWINKSEINAPHEASFLKLDCSRIKNKLGWMPKWNLTNAVEKTIEWTKSWVRGEDIKRCMDIQIEDLKNHDYDKQQRFTFRYKK